MRKIVRARTSVVLFPILVILALVATACGGTAPQDREIPVKLTGGQLDPGTIQVGQNDTVTLKIEADQPGSIHLHGYDLEQEVKPGEATDFVFVADASGRFRIAFHPTGDDHGSHEENGHGEIFQSEVMHPAGTYSLVVTPDLVGKVIPYHSHLHPEVAGTIQVRADAPAADTVRVEISDGATNPSEIMVRPGTTIIWTNNSSEIQVLASGLHSEAAEDSHDDTDHPPEGAATDHSDHESDEEEEIDVGFLEVQPR